MLRVRTQMLSSPLRPWPVVMGLRGMADSSKHIAVPIPEKDRDHYRRQMTLLRREFLAEHMSEQHRIARIRAAEEAEALRELNQRRRLRKEVLRLKLVDRESRYHKYYVKRIVADNETYLTKIIAPQNERDDEFLKYLRHTLAIKDRAISKDNIDTALTQESIFGRLYSVPGLAHVDPFMQPWWDWKSHEIEAASSNTSNRVEELVKAATLKLKVEINDMDSSPVNSPVSDEQFLKDCEWLDTHQDDPSMERLRQSVWQLAEEYGSIEDVKNRILSPERILELRTERILSFEQDNRDRKEDGLDPIEADHSGDINTLFGTVDRSRSSENIEDQDTAEISEVDLDPNDVAVMMKSITDIVLDRSRGEDMFPFNIAKENGDKESYNVVPEAGDSDIEENVSDELAFFTDARSNTASDETLPPADNKYSNADDSLNVQQRATSKLEKALSTDQFQDIQKAFSDAMMDGEFVSGIQSRVIESVPPQMSSIQRLTTTIDGECLRMYGKSSKSVTTEQWGVVFEEVVERGKGTSDEELWTSFLNLTKAKTSASVEETDKRIVYEEIENSMFTDALNSFQSPTNKADISQLKNTLRSQFTRGQTESMNPASVQDIRQMMGAMADDNFLKRGNVDEIVDNTADFMMSPGQNVQEDLQQLRKLTEEMDPKIAEKLFQSLKNDEKCDE